MSDACGMNEAIVFDRLLGLSISPYLNTKTKFELLVFVSNAILNTMGERDLRGNVVTIRLNEDEYEAVKQFCDEKGFSLSEYFRVIMRIHLGSVGFTQYAKYLFENDLLCGKKD